MSSSFFVNLYNATDLYSSDIYYYYGEMDHKVPRYDVYAEDLYNNLCYRNESNKFYLKSPSFGVIEVRIQLNII